MKLRSHIVVLALLAAVLVGFFYSTFRSTEPHCDGKPLSFWLREIEASLDAGTVRWQRAARAVRQIGTNAIPSLLTMLQTPDSLWKAEAVDWLQETVELDLTETLGSIRGRRAITGFRLLGPVASDAALPRLAALATHRNPRISSQALSALGEIGGAAMAPTLVTVLTNGNPAARLQAASSLGALRGQGQDAVPALVETLGDPDFTLRAFTAASILISGGQGRLKPSPGSFFVASMPSLLPLAISLVAWSSTSSFIVAADVSRLTLSSVSFSRSNISASLSGLTSAVTG